MTDDREPFREPRAAWKAKHHEQRLENATYTAAEVKVLTEAALRLGRAEGAEGEPDRWLDRDRLIAIKWGDKVIDPTEVAYVLRDIDKGDPNG